MTDPRTAGRGGGAELPNVDHGGGAQPPTVGRGGGRAALPWRLVAVRHTAVAVAPGICYGAQDVPLAADWRSAVASAASEALAAAVRAAEIAPAGTGFPAGTDPRAGTGPRADQQPPPILLWSSPATRCRTLARHIGEQIGTPVRVDARLAEMDFGEWEGQRWDDIEHDPRYARWSANWQTESTPGESLPAVVARVRAVLAEIAEDTASPADSATPRPVPLIVTHLGVIRACNHIYRSTALSDFLDCTVEPGGVIAWERLRVLVSGGAGCRGLVSASGGS